MNESAVNETGVFQTQLGSENIANTIYPSVNWDYEKLKELTQPGTVDIRFKALLDNQEIDNKSLRLNYRSVNECVIAFNNGTDGFVDTMSMFAAYINEDHLLIDVFLQEILEKNVINAFTGYQLNDKQSVKNQIFAVWHAMQLKSMKYSSITGTSNSTDKVLTQYVRFFDEVYNNTQANCVDGSVFLCSVLKKIGIKPFLVTKPGHMYMGYFLNANKSEIALLETTYIGLIDLNDITTEANLIEQVNLNNLPVEIFNSYKAGTITLDDVKKVISLSTFIKATNFRNEEYNNSIDAMNDPAQWQYQFIDIELARESIKPIGR